MGFPGIAALPLALLFLRLRLAVVAAVVKTLTEQMVAQVVEALLVRAVQQPHLEGQVHLGRVILVVTAAPAITHTLAVVAAVQQQQGVTLVLRQQVTAVLAHSG